MPLDHPEVPRDAGSGSGVNNGDGDGIVVVNGESSVAHTNGAAAHVTRPSDDGPLKLRNVVRKEEYVRLLVQALRRMGYDSSARSLEKESGYILEAPAVAKLRSGVMDGDWKLVDSLLPEMNVDEEDDLPRARFLVYQQKFLELLERREVTMALECLRQELTPLRQEPDRLHKLSRLMMCRNADDLRARAEWKGAGQESRLKLLTDLQAYIPPWVMVPEGRMEQLIAQGLQLQTHNCMYHNTTDDEISLLEDHKCDRDQIPCETQHTFEQHTDEVWFVRFSHNGKKLASASKDKTIMIWDMTEFRHVHTLVGHSDALSFVAWSPNDKMLLSCGNDNKIKMWDAETGVCLHTFSRHSNSVTSCAWCPDEKRFISGSLDQNLFLWDIHGNILRNWHAGRVADLAITSDGNRVVVITHDKKIRIYGINDDYEDVIEESESLTSLCLSRDDKNVLVNLSLQEIHVWNLETRTMTHKYVGHRQGRYVIRSGFGGTNDTFVVSGSEDSKVYIWHRHHAKLLDVLVGHAATVNSVCWNPKNPYMFASASDDHSIRVWGVPKRRVAGIAWDVASSEANNGTQTPANNNDRKRQHSASP
eukprot:Opistho-2@80313